MNSETVEELVSELGSIIERVTDLAYDALREQAAGNAEYKELEKKLSSVRRSLVKAESTLRDLR
jgi:hypothetical protein